MAHARTTERRALLSACAAVFALAVEGSALAQPRPRPEITPPTVVTHVDAEYPKSALARGVHADVTLEVIVDADGHVSKVDVVSSGGKDVDEAAIAAMRQWTFAPATRNGTPVAARIRVPFHFAPPPAPPDIVTPPPSEPPVVTAKPPVAPSPAAAGGDVQEVDVVGAAPLPSYGASTFDFHFKELARVPNKNASEMLRAAAPGLLLTNEGGEGHAEQVFLRGFDAREGQDLEFSVGGMPINESGNLHGNGYADTHFIIPELVESLRVVEGPFDPRQGNYAVAGSANYELGLAQRGVTGKVTVGSFGTKRMLLTWGPKGESEHTLGGAEIASTRGFGQNRDADRASAMGQYEGKLGSRGLWRIFAQGYSTHFHTAGVIREDDYKAGRVGFYDSYDLSSYAHEQVPQGGDAARYSTGGSIETKTGDTTLKQQVFLIKRTMRLVENFTGFLLDVQSPLQSVHEQRGDTLDLNVDETTVGARGSARMEAKALGQKQELELGYFARGDWTKGTQQRLEAATGAPYRTDTDLDSQLGDLGLYADASARALSWLNFRGGVRSDLFTYDVLDDCASHDVAHPPRTNPPVDQSCLDVQDFGRHREPNQRSSTSSVGVMPRGALLFGPFTGFTFNVSYGKGIRSVDPVYISQDVKTPFASVNAYETGATYTRTIGETELVARSIFFETDVDKTLVFNQTAGRNILGVGSTRRGWVGATRLTGSFFDEAASLTLVRSTYDDTHLLVAYVPDVVFRSDTALYSNLPFSIQSSKVRGALGTGITYVGPRPLPYGQRGTDIFTIDASATLAWKNFEIGLMVTNLLDRQYRLGQYDYASDFHSQPHPTLVPERQFTAGAPRGIFGTFAINFGGT